MQILGFAKIIEINGDEVTIKSDHHHTVKISCSELGVLGIPSDDQKQLESYLKEEIEFPVVLEKNLNKGQDWRVSLELFEDGRDLAPIRMIRKNDPITITVSDTNTKKKIYGETEEGLNCRLDKAEIRRRLQDNKILPSDFNYADSLLTGELTEEELQSADVYDDQMFWRDYYPLHEIYPGDQLVGAVTLLEFHKNDKPILFLKLNPILDHVNEKPEQVLTFFSDEEFSQSSIEDDQIKDESLLFKKSNKNEKVLIVDDEVEVLRAVSEILKKTGYSVEACENLDQAKKYLINYIQQDNQEKLHAAIIDINLSDTSYCKEYHGFDLATEIQSVMPACGIILTSAELNHHNNKVEKCDDLKVVGYFPKPYSPNQLLQYVCDAPTREKVLASTYFPVNETSLDRISREINEQHQCTVETIKEDLKRILFRLNADSVFVFKMYITSRKVDLIEFEGKRFPQWQRYKKNLRYSPVRNICEDEQVFCHHDINESNSNLMQFYRNFLKLCDVDDQFTACAGCSINLPVQDSDVSYALVAFKFKKENDNYFGLRPEFDQVPEGIMGTPEHSRFVKLLLKEEASKISLILTREWLENIQSRQSSLLMLGMHAASKGHDMDNKLLGANLNIQLLIIGLKQGELDDLDLISKLKILYRQILRATELAQEAAKSVRALIEEESVSSVQQSIKRTVGGLMLNAKNENVSIYTDCGSDFYLKCIWGAFERTLFNIVLNGIQQVSHSFRSNGMLFIKSRLKKEKNAEYLIVNIYDSGPGIHSFMKNSIFLPGETTRKEGSGLGLSICKSEMRRIKGSIKIIKSLLLIGTHFEISIPVEIILDSDQKGNVNV